MTFDLPSRCSLLLLGSTEDEVYAIQGRLEVADAGHVFIQHDGGGRLAMEAAWLERAKPVTPDLESIFGAASPFFIPVAIGDLPADSEGGLRLPRDEDDDSVT
jgi:hypothetical protein